MPKSVTRPLPQPSVTVRCVPPIGSEPPPRPLLLHRAAVALAAGRALPTRTRGLAGGVAAAVRCPGAVGGSLARWGGEAGDKGELLGQTATGHLPVVGVATPVRPSRGTGRWCGGTGC